MSYRLVARDESEAMPVRRLTRKVLKVFDENDEDYRRPVVRHCEPSLRD